MSLFNGLLAWTTITFGSYGLLGLFILAFAESSFFPVPPDVLLIAFALAEPQNAFIIAGVATIGSVLGGIFGYWLGHKFGEPLLLRFAKKKQVEHIQKIYAELGPWAVFAAGFSPIPYKVFTIFSGIMGLDIKKFIIASVASRGLRFFGVATVIFLYGEEIRAFLEQYFELITIVVAIPVILFVLWKFYRHRMENHGKFL
ncbi:MAG: DedA family protein [archaeon]|nr:DedA family protein [archaeon]